LISVTTIIPCISLPHSTTGQTVYKSCRHNTKGATALVRILDYNVTLLLERVDEALRYGEYKDFNDGLHSKVKLRNAIDVKFRSGTNGLNEELGRYQE